MVAKKILLTGTDFPPKVGGLAQYTQQIANVLNSLGLEVIPYSWDSQSIRTPSEKLLANLKESDWVINTHSVFCHFISDYERNYSYKTINFIQGTELCFTSPQLLKSLYKKIFRNKILRPIKSSAFNIFISEFTLKKIASEGLVIDHARDLVFYPAHEKTPGPAFDLSLIKSKYKSFYQEGAQFIWTARDAPHKNFTGIIRFCLEVKKLSNKKVTLYLSPAFKNHPIVQSITQIDFKFIDSNISRDEAYRLAHFNLIFSLDLSHKGHFEGFGLTALEAGEWGTPTLALRDGGQSEAVHHFYTGLVFNQIAAEEVNFLFNFFKESDYLRLANNCRYHTINGHEINSLKNLLQRLIESRKGIEVEKNSIAI